MADPRLIDLKNRIHAAAARHGITPEDLTRALRRDRLISLYSKRVVDAKEAYARSPRTRDDSLRLAFRLEMYRAALNVLLRAEG